MFRLDGTILANIFPEEIDLTERRGKMLKRSLVAASFLCLVLGVLVSGCGKGGLPTSPKTGLSDGELRFIPLPNPEGGSVACGMEIRVEGEVTPKRAAQLKLHYERDPVEVQVRLHVPAHAVSQPAVWSLSLYPDIFVTEIGFVFGPGGLEFLRPAKLSIDASGLDLSGIDPESLGLYRCDDSGHWELIEAIHLYVYPGGRRGPSQIRGLWWIEHFSRYALASR